MCKRNFRDKNEASTGCVRETSQTKKTKTKTKRSQHGIRQRNSRIKIEASAGCVRQTPEIKMKPARDV